MTKIAPWAFVLAVPDLARSADFFREVMGFKVHWEEAPDWRLVQRDSVRIMLGKCPNDVPASEVGSHNYFGYLEVDDGDALHDELTGRGANCTSPKNATYGMREIVVTTIDGHRICFCAGTRSVLIASRRAVSMQNARVFAAGGL